MTTANPEIWRPQIILIGNGRETLFSCSMFSICRGKQDKIVLELLSTEKSYVDDLKIVLSGYKQKVIYDSGNSVSINTEIISDGFLKNKCQGSNNIW